MKIYSSLVILSVVYTLTLVLIRQKRRRNTSPTIPLLSTWLPWLGVDNAISFVRNPRAFLENGTKRHGPVFMFTLFGKKVAFINHPVTLTHLERQTHALDDRREIERAVIASSGLSEPKLMVDTMLNRLIPIVLHRLSTASLSTPDSTKYYTQLLEAEMDAMSPVASPATKMSVWDFMGRSTYNASSIFLFGSSFPTETYDDLTATFYRIALIAGPMGNLPFYTGTRARGRLLKALCAYLKPCWEDGVDVDVVFPDAHELITESCHIMKEAGCSLQEAAGVFIGFLFGIHGNIWFTLHQFLGRVLLEPKYKALIEEETRQTSEITKMKYLESAMWESLRRPFRFVQIRRTIEDVEIQIGKERYFVEKDTWFMPKSFNHDVSTFPEPFEFKPDRFLDSTIPKPRPFGEGHRVCKGRDFAKWSMMSFTAKAFEKFDMTPLDKNGNPLTDLTTERTKFKPEGSMILIDKIDGKDDLWVELRRRSS